MNSIHALVHPISAPRPISNAPAADPAGHARSPQRTFGSVLNQAQVTLSGHAQKRMAQRGLSVGPDEASKLASAIDRAAAKGSKRSLVFLDEWALLVQVPERVVVTAMPAGAMRDGVVTRIDSAVVA
jgi:flagellar operon protein